MDKAATCCCDLLALDTVLASVDWGHTMLIDYKSQTGEALKSAVILPPGYQPGHRYPTLVWVYPSYRVRTLDDDYWLDPFLPGIYISSSMPRAATSS